MTKSGYLVNSAKLLLVCSCLLFAANLFVFLGKSSESMLFFGNKLSDIAFYVVLVLGFLSFNGEGISYKISRDLKRKNHTRLLKALLIFAFLLRYIKKPFANVLLAVSAETLGGAFLRLFLGAFNTVASYGFLFTIVSLWYYKRDSHYNKLSKIELISFIVGMVSNLYKTLNFSVTKYSLTYFGGFFTSIFSSDSVMYTLILAQFLVNTLMFIIVFKEYEKNLTQEHNEKEKKRKSMVFSRNIYTSDGFGVDTLEDDYLNN